MPTGTRSVWEDKPFHECRNEGALGTSKWEHRFKGHFQMLGSKWFQSYSLPSYAIPCQCRSSRAVRRALAAISEQPRMCLWHLRSKTWPDSRSLWRGVYTSLFDPNAKSSSLGTHKNAHREMFMKVKWKHNCRKSEKEATSVNQCAFRWPRELQSPCSPSAWNNMAFSGTTQSHVRIHVHMHKHVPHTMGCQQ